jgi:hypothetical protein
MQWHGAGYPPLSSEPIAVVKREDAAERKLDMAARSRKTVQPALLAGAYEMSYEECKCCGECRCCFRFIENRPGTGAVIGTHAAAKAVSRQTATGRPFEAAQVARMLAVRKITIRKAVLPLPTLR